MSSAQWFSCKASGSSAPNTLYCTLPTGHVGPSTTESTVQAPNRIAGVFSKLYIRVTANDRTATSTVTFRTGAADGNQSISIGAGLTGDFMDGSNTDTVAGSGELLDIKLIVGTGGTVFTWAVLSVLFSPTTDDAVKLEALGSGQTVGPNNTQYQSICGLGSTQTTEANEQHKIRLTGTLKNLFANIATNSLNSASTTIRVRKGGANGNQLVTIGAGLTGIFEDTTHTDSVVADDLVNYQTVVASGGTGTIGYGNIGCDLTATNLYELNNATNNGISVAQNSTLYISPSGALSTNSTEDNVKGRVNSSGFTASKLQVYVRINSIAASTTVRTRKNGANGAQSISIGSTLTGFFEDASNSGSFATNDYIDYQIVTPASGSNTIVVNNIGILITPVSSISPSTIASTLALGTDKLNPTIKPTALASTLGLGPDKLNPTIFPSGRASTLSLGEPGLLTAGAISPSGINSTLVISTGDKLNPTILVSGIASTIGLGTAKLIATIVAQAIGSTLSIGTAKLNPIILPVSIGSGAVFGTAELIRPGILSPVSIASGLSFGTAKLNPIVLITGMASTLALGTPGLSSVARILPIGIASTAGVGAPKLNLLIIVAGIPASGGIGSPRLSTAIQQTIVVPSIGPVTVVGGHYVVALLECIEDGQALPIVGPSEFQAEHRAPEPPSGVGLWD